MQFPRLEPNSKNFISGRSFNGLADGVTDYWRKRDKFVPGASKNHKYNGSVVLCENRTGMELDRYQLINVTQPLSTPGENEDVFKGSPKFKGYSVTDTSKNVGVVLRAVDNLQVTEVLMDGITMCRIQTVKHNHKWLRPDTTYGSTKFETCYHPTGYRILWQEGLAEGQEEWARIQIGMPVQQVMYPGVVVNGDITANTAGDVELYEKGAATGFEITGVELDWLHGGEDISNGTRVFITYFPQEDLWRITGADCETP